VVGQPEPKLTSSIRLVYHWLNNSPPCIDEPLNWYKKKDFTRCEKKLTGKANSIGLINQGLNYSSASINEPKQFHDIRCVFCCRFCVISGLDLVEMDVSCIWQSFTGIQTIDHWDPWLFWMFAAGCAITQLTLWNFELKKKVKQFMPVYGKPGSSTLVSDFSPSLHCMTQTSYILFSYLHLSNLAQAARWKWKEMMVESLFSWL